MFVLDVNRNFQPWLVERSRLYEAMNTFDGPKSVACCLSSNAPPRNGPFVD